MCGLGSNLSESLSCSVKWKDALQPQGCWGYRSYLKALEICFLWKGKVSVGLGVGCWLLGEEREAGRERERINVSSLSLTVQSLDWETFEQYCAWQLFLAHNIPLETIIPILQHLKYKGE